MIWNMKKISLLIFLGIALLLFNSSSAQALECEDLSDITKKIQCLNDKIRGLQSQSRTLFSQIAVMDSQIRLTESRILATRQEIAELTLDIDTADKKIENLEKSLDNLIKVLINRMIATYQIGSAQPFEILLSSNNVSSFFSRLNYLRIAQQHDKQLIYLTQQAKSDYTNQKLILEEKKKRAEALKATLDKYTLQLEQEKRNKQALLDVTRNDETIYQRLLNDALSIQRALANVGTKIGNVNKGDVIASAGNTGCSTGAHLHFEVYERAKIQGGSVVDVNTGEAIQFKISDHLVNPMNYINDGRFQHPLPGSVITTQFMEQYFRGSHTGVDFAYKFSDGSTYGRPIYAAEKGVAYLAQDSQLCGGFESNGVGKGAVIDHQNGLVTLYWHIQ